MTLRTGEDNLIWRRRLCIALYGGIVFGGGFGPVVRQNTEWMNLSWKTHIEYIKTKLSSACYAVRSVKPFLTINILKMIYYSYFHLLMTYELLFWGNSPDSIQNFRLQIKIIRIMRGCRYRDSCRKLFSNLEILPLPSQYILSLLMFIRNRSQFLINSEIVF